MSYMKQQHETMHECISIAIDCLRQAETFAQEGYPASAAYNATQAARLLTEAYHIKYKFQEEKSA